MKNFPKRKNPRKKDFDYSSANGYFITICSQSRRNIFSEIVWDFNEATVKLSDVGKIAENEFYLLEEKHSNILIDQLMIMPDHIHAIIYIKKDGDGSESLTKLIGEYKSIVTKKSHFFLQGKIFQTSFYDHIIRNQNDYQEIVQYISNNPIKWARNHIDS